MIFFVLKKSNVVDNRFNSNNSYVYKFLSVFNGVIVYSINTLCRLQFSFGMGGRERVGSFRRCSTRYETDVIVFDNSFGFAKYHSFSFGTKKV